MRQRPRQAIVTLAVGQDKAQVRPAGSCRLADGPGCCATVAAL